MNVSFLSSRTIVISSMVRVVNFVNFVNWLRKSVVFQISFALVLLGSACVRVQPYQRQTHAKASMQDPDALSAKLDNHVKEYREGSVGGSGASGGGCGCN